MKLAILFSGRILLEKTLANDYYIPEKESFLCSLPEVREVSTFLVPRKKHQVKVFVVGEEMPVDGMQWMELRAAFDLLSEDDFSIAVKARELAFWYEQTVFCSVCATPLLRSTEISKCCPSCKREFWPQVIPAIIVLVKKGDEVLLTRNKNFRGNYWGLVAGFVETGETLEECVAREVLEETGISIKNIRYAASQPWAFPSHLMLGFIADYAAGNIVVQEEELLCAQWFHRDRLPELPGKVSLARRLLDAWLQNKTF